MSLYSKQGNLVEPMDITDSKPFQAQRVVSFKLYAQEQKVRLGSMYPFLPQEQIYLKIKDRWNKMGDDMKQNYTKAVLCTTPNKKSPLAKKGRKCDESSLTPRETADKLKCKSASARKTLRLSPAVSSKTKVSDWLMDTKQSSSKDAVVKKTYDGSRYSISHEVPMVIDPTPCKQPGILKCDSSEKKGNCSGGKAKQTRRSSRVSFSTTNENNDPHLTNSRGKERKTQKEATHKKNFTNIHNVLNFGDKGKGEMNDKKTDYLDRNLQKKKTTESNSNGIVFYEDKEDLFTTPEMEKVSAGEISKAPRKRKSSSKPQKGSEPLNNLKTASPQNLLPDSPLFDDSANNITSMVFGPKTWAATTYSKTYGKKTRHVKQGNRKIKNSRERKENKKLCKGTEKERLRNTVQKTKNTVRSREAPIKSESLTIFHNMENNMADDANNDDYSDDGSELPKGILLRNPDDEDDSFTEDDVDIEDNCQAELSSSKTSAKQNNKIKLKKKVKEVKATTSLMKGVKKVTCSSDLTKPANKMGKTDKKKRQNCDQNNEIQKMEKPEISEKYVSDFSDDHIMTDNAMTGMDDENVTSNKPAQKTNKSVSKVQTNIKSASSLINKRQSFEENSGSSSRATFQNPYLHKQEVLSLCKGFAVDSPLSSLPSDVDDLSVDESCMEKPVMMPPEEGSSNTTLMKVLLKMKQITSPTLVEIEHSSPKLLSPTLSGITELSSLSDTPSTFKGQETKQIRIAANSHMKQPLEGEVFPNLSRSGHQRSGRHIRSQEANMLCSMFDELTPPEKIRKSAQRRVISSNTAQRNTNFKNMFQEDDFFG